MPFSLWHKSSWLALVLFPAMALWFLFPASPFVRGVAIVAAGVFLVLGAIGAVMGAFMAMDRLKMRCPFCGKFGRVLGRNFARPKMWLACPNCGFVYAEGWFGKMVRTSVDPESPDRE
jgi:hypothetical protein